MRISRRVRSASLGLALAALGAFSFATAAETGLSAVQGAWLDPSLSCEAVFSPAGKGLSFKKPVDIFVPAFIIAGNRLTTPQATCRITSAKPSGDRRRVSLDCANRVSTADVQLSMSMDQDGSLRRYFNDEDETGRPYKRCPR